MFSRFAEFSDAQQNRERLTSAHMAASIRETTARGVRMALEEVGVG